MTVDLSGYLKSHAISPEVAEVMGVQLCERADQLPLQLQGEPLLHPRYLPGVSFDWRSVDGVTVEHQYRPLADGWNRHKLSQKYDQVANRHLPLNVHPSRRERVLDGTSPLLIVEGTCQHLAAVSHAPEEYGIIGIFGCNGWQRDQLPHPDFGLIPLAGRVVHVCFDADAATNRQVYDALFKLKKYLGAEGAEFRHVTLPAGGTAGLDDYLARIAQDRQEQNLSNLIDQGTAKLPRKPPMGAGRRADEDEEVAAVSKQDEEEEARLRELDDTLPDEPLADVLDAIVDQFEAVTVFPDPSYAHVLALWVEHTYCLGRFDFTPRLHFSSATRVSGKSQTMEQLKKLCRRGLMALSMSTSVMFRLIAKRHPTLLFDEIDNAGLSVQERGDIIALMNGGFSREGGTVWRTDPETLDPVEFDPFGPLALSGIALDALPDPLVSRSILLPMERATALELRHVEKYRTRIHGPRFLALADRAAVWAFRHAHEIVTDPMPAVPDEMDGRAADVWEPLFCIAATAGGPWPERVRIAALADHERHKFEDASPGELVLWACKEIFDERRRDASVPKADEDVIPTTALIRALAEFDEVPVVENVQQLRRHLKPFKVPSGRPRMAGRQVRGYTRRSFERAWWRYPDLRPKDEDEPGFEDVGDAEDVSPPDDSERAGSPSEPTQVSHPTRGGPQDEPNESDVTPESPETGSPLSRNARRRYTGRHKTWTPKEESA